MGTEKPLKIAVCDDEKEIREHIRREINIFYPDIKVVVFSDGASLLNYKEDIDILFLDIQMNGINGMEAARRIRKNENNVTIIFVTAIEEYVFQAFDVGAFNYIVKPIERVRFFEVLKKAVDGRKRVKTDDAGEEPGITVKTGGVTQKVFLHEILYMEVFNRKIIIHKQNGSMEFYGKLKSFEALLGNDFMRCHRSFLVNLRYVQKYDSESITLENGKSILLAKQKYQDFVKRYMEYTNRLMEKRLKGPL